MFILVPGQHGDDGLHHIDGGGSLRSDVIERRFFGDEERNVGNVDAHPVTAVADLLDGERVVQISANKIILVND
jgi:hypothetical protein